MSEEECIKEIENYLDYDGSVSINAIATLYTLYNKEKEKNAELNKLKGFEMLDIFNMGKESSRQRIKYDWIEKSKIRELRQKLSIIADNEYYKYKKSTTTFVNICGICADIDDLLEE